jgi:hypothetical protein
MSWFRRKRLTGPELAEMLHGILACEEYPPLAASNFEVPQAVVGSYNQRLFLYREALIYLALIEREPSNSPILGLTLSAYQSIIFGDNYKASVESGRREALNAATMDLADLVKPGSDIDILWGRRWLAELGYDETDLITLTLFNTAWIGLFLAARESVGNNLAG